MTTYTMTGPDGKDYSIDGPPGATQAQVAAQMATAHANLTAAPAPQPTIMQDIVASPLGRGIHDAIFKPAEAIGGLALKSATPILANFFGGPAAAAATAGVPLSAYQKGLSAAPEAAYSGAVTAQQNRPGYAAARSQADKMLVQRGSGFQDQVTAPLNPAVAGAVGLFGSGGDLNSSNAAMDAQTAAQNAYATANPVKSIIGQTIGGLAMGAPELPKRATLPALPPSTAADQGLGYVQRLMSSSSTAPDAAGLDAAQKAANGKPITSAEAIGKPAGVALGALARREGATADALGGEMAARQAEAPGRILDDFSAASGIDPTLAKGDIEGYVAAGRQTAKPMFDQALAGDNGVWNADLARLSNRPVVQSAMQNVVEDLKNADIDPTGLGFTGQDPVTGKFIQQPRPTAQAWDMVKKRLGQAVERDPFGRIIPDSVSPGNYNINGANRDVTAALREAIPGYGDALDASGDYLSMQKSFSDGQNFILNPKVTAAQVQTHMASLSDSEAQAFKGGIANKLFDLQQNGRLGTKLADAPSVQTKLSLALGTDNAAKFIQNLSTEKGMANFARLRVPGAGSPTAEYNEAMATQDGTGISPELVNFAANTARRGPVSAATSYVLGKGADALAAYRTGGMSVRARDAAGNYLMMSPGNLANVLKARGNAPVLPTTPLRLPKLSVQAPLPYGLLTMPQLQQRQ